jgi:L-ascorbate metabolism protein UlaG (beta-lactamase superfamily)
MLWKPNNRLALTLLTLSVWLIASLASNGHGTATAATNGQLNGQQNGQTPAGTEYGLTLPSTQAADFASGSVLFVGNATVIIRYAGFTILTDPNFLHKGGRVHLGYGLTAQRLTDPALALEKLPPIDLIVLSHMDGDHFDQLVQQKLNRNIPIITTLEAAQALQQLGFNAFYPLKKWDSLLVQKGEASLRITAMPARPGPAAAAALLPETMGSMLTFRRPDRKVAFRAYISGDTLLHEDIEEIARRYPDIDLALLHLGGTKVLKTVRLTMDAVEGVQMLKIIAPRQAIPIHFNDYDVFKSPLQDFVKQVKAAGLQGKVTYLKHGQTYTFAGAPR